MKTLLLFVVGLIGISFLPTGSQADCRTGQCRTVRSAPRVVQQRVVQQNVVQKVVDQKKVEQVAVKAQAVTTLLPLVATANLGVPAYTASYQEESSTNKALIAVLERIEARLASIETSLTTSGAPASAGATAATLATAQS